MFLILALLSLGFSKPPTKPIELPAQALAWGDNKANWDLTLKKAINEANIPMTTDMPCKRVVLNECFARLVSIMAKYESSFNPDAAYKESFKDSKGKRVVSRGLLQLSIESANQKAYGCNISNAKDLHDPEINLKCAVKIISHQAKKSGTLIDGSRGGCSSYWSVCRKSSKSYDKIMSYMEKF